MIPRALATALLLLSWAAHAQAPDPEAPAPADPAAAAPSPAQVPAAAPTNPTLTDPAAGPAAPGPAAPAPAQEQAPVPPEPAAAPPAPARLNGAATAAPTPAQAAWPAGMVLLDNGALRLRLAADAPDAAQRRAIEEIGRRLAAIPAGRVVVEVQVSFYPRDHSLARRQALSRALAVKAALVAGGLEATRIDLRPLGRLDPPADFVDILPPGARSTTPTR